MGTKNQTECGNECAKVCGKNKGLWLMKRTCEADLGTVLLVVTRVTNTKVVRLYFAFSTIFHGWGWRHKIIGFYKVQRCCKMITVTLKPCNIPHRGNWTVMQHLFLFFFYLVTFLKIFNVLIRFFFQTLHTSILLMYVTQNKTQRKLPFCLYNCWCLKYSWYILYIYI